MQNDYLLLYVLMIIIIVIAVIKTQHYTGLYLMPNIRTPNDLENSIFFLILGNSFN